MPRTDVEYWPRSDEYPGYFWISKLYGRYQARGRAAIGYVRCLCYLHCT